MLNLPLKTKNIWLVALFSGYLLLFFSYYQLPDQLFHIYFLDIGQGDSILIKTPENHQILIDGGPKNTVLQELGEVMPFFDKSLDMVVLTHPHADHMDGLIAVLKKYEVENVLFTGVGYQSGTYDEFLRELEDANIFLAEAEEDFRLGGVVLDVIYPFDKVTGENFPNLNNSSVVLKVIYDYGVHKKVKILLSGDLEVEGERELVKSGVDLSADIFKAGHHGSKTSSSLDFLAKIRPQIVVIQSGIGNKFGHPSKETLENFQKMGIEKIYRNDQDGRVEFVF